MQNICIYCKYYSKKIQEKKRVLIELCTETRFSYVK